MTEKVASEEILLISEILKICMAMGFIFQDKEPSDTAGVGFVKLFNLVKSSSKMFILAAIYALMNILSFISLQHIGAGEFTICAQLKILSVCTECVPFYLLK